MFVFLVIHLNSNSEAKTDAKEIICLNFPPGRAVITRVIRIKKASADASLNALRLCALAWGSCGHAKARPYSADAKTKKLCLLSNVLCKLSEKTQETKS